jgi:hypothetical protein
MSRGRVVAPGSRAVVQCRRASRRDHGAAATRGWCDVPRGAEGDPLSKYSLSPAEGVRLTATLAAGNPAFVFRDGGGELTVAPLDERCQGLSIGRADSAALRLRGDARVSRAHAEVRHVAGQWMIWNLSRNGTHLNTARIDGPARLADGDRIRLGRTVLAFLAPADRTGTETGVDHDSPDPARFTEVQRRVLRGLCRPMLDDAPYGAPATNREIADELNVTVDAVKTQLGLMFTACGLSALNQGQKRNALARLAIESGAVSRRDLASGPRG